MNNSQLTPKIREPIPPKPSKILKLPFEKKVYLSIFASFIIFIILLIVLIPPQATNPDSTPSPEKGFIATTIAPIKKATQTIALSDNSNSQTSSTVVGVTENKPDIGSMVLIKKGTFYMGATQDEAEWHQRFCNKYDRCVFIDYSDMLPQHEVYLDSYYIDVNEVTNAQYKECVQSKKCSPPNQSYISQYLDSDYYSNSKYDSYPVVSISWQDASQYCEWSGKRLPTEAEWEKAAKAGSNWTYAWLQNTTSTTPKTIFDGNIPLLNFCDTNCLLTDVKWVDKTVSDNWGGPAPVMSYPPNPLGIYDLNGNVQEWVQDYYSESYYSNSPKDNPVNNTYNDSHMTRGGGWNNGLYHSTSMYRRATYSDRTKAFLGFRCVMDAE